MQQRSACTGRLATAETVAADCCRSDGRSLLRTARTINNNYIVLNISATIAWNLITAYDDDLPYAGRGIMGVANKPWCGSFEPYAAVWASAHTTWFTKPDLWRYVGGGHLARGGSWVALTDGKGGLTIVIEKQAWEDTNQGQ